MLLRAQKRPRWVYFSHLDPIWSYRSALMVVFHLMCMHKFWLSFSKSFPKRKIGNWAEVILYGWIKKMNACSIPLLKKNTFTAVWCHWVSTYSRHFLEKKESQKRCKLNWPFALYTVIMQTIVLFAEMLLYLIIEIVSSCVTPLLSVKKLCEWPYLPWSLVCD